MEGSPMMDRDKYNKVQAAKALLMEYGYIIITKAHYDDLQKRIIDLGVYDEQQHSLIQQLIAEGLVLIYSINNCPGFWLSHNVAEKMNKFIELLHETHNKYPLADDEMCRCGHPSSKHYDVSHGCLVDGCNCMDYVEVENGANQ